MQWNDSVLGAAKQYTLVEQVLLAAGEDHLLTDWLGQPVGLPDEQDLWPMYGLGAPPPESVVVEARYTVTSRGDVRDIDVSVAKEEDAWQAGRIRRMLRDTHFRPRFHGGLTQSVEQIEGRYQLVDP